MAFELDRKQIKRMLRQRLAATAILLFVAIALTWAWLYDAWLFGHAGKVRHTVATVTDLQQQVFPERWIARFAYDGADGLGLQAEVRFDQAPLFATGDRVPFVHSLDGRPMARPVTPDERFVSNLMLGMALAMWVTGALLVVMVVRPYQRRRRLLDRGIAEAVGSARVETREYSLVGDPQLLWRLSAGQFDAALPGWREYHSDWQTGPPPVLDADTPLPSLLRDPVNGDHHWLPVATWAAGRSKPG